MAELLTLKNQREVIKGNLERFKSYLDSIKTLECDEKIILQVTLRLEKIWPYWDSFNDVQGKIEVLESSNIDENERDVFENNYFTIIGDAKAFLKQYETTSNVSEVNSEGSRASAVGSNSNTINSNSFVRLPPIKLPVFDGKYSSWLEFKDSFTALVDENEQLTDIQKFLYLKSSLEKEVLQIIKAIEVSAKNYKVAWQFLNDRYENKKLMIYNHIRAIFEYPSLAKESFSELRNLYDNVAKNLRSLNSLGEDTDSWDRLIIYIMSNKFDNITRRDWESYQYKSELPTMLDLNEFLKEKCEILEKIEITKSETKSEKHAEKHKVSKQVHLKRQSVSNSYAAIDNKLACYYCNQNHMIYKCQSFLDLSIEDRVAAIKKLKLCLNCLRSSKHLSWNCKAQKCNKCEKAHNTLLHIEFGDKSNDVNMSKPESTAVNTATDTKMDVSENKLSTSYITRNILAEQSHVLLSTAIIKIKNVDNKYIKLRALLDSGSQSNFISENACKRLGFQPTAINHLIKGVGETLANITKKVNVTVRSCYSEFELNIDCLILPKITDKLPRISFNKCNLKLPENLQLADPTFNIAADIDILLGSAIFWSVLCVGQESLGHNSPIMQNTQLGWIIAGNLLLNSKLNNSSLSYLNVNCSNSIINENILKFWQIEEVDSKKVFLSNEEEYCEKHFNNTTRRTNEGRFIVNIPFKPSINELGDSHEMALRRFNLLERKLEKNNELKADYQAFMADYEKLNHMNEIEYKPDKLEGGYFMPHHAVIKSSSSTTKCRVVFDASAKTSTNISLNEAQYIGPKLQQDLFCILMRFRKHKIVMTADISKMYCQILICEDHLKYQRILWRYEPDEKLRCYELRTVTYGTASAPYLAVRCLVQLAKESEQRFPEISKIIENDFYMDDVLTGAETVSEALDIQRNLLHIMNSAGFQLRKWLSNNDTVLNGFKKDDNLEMSVLRVGPSEQSKTLGVCWNSNSDTIQYSITNDYYERRFTKRSILSVTCQIFDPLGLLGPIVILAKLIIQELWESKVEWDEIVPEKIRLKWTTFLEELPLINNIEVPKHILISNYVTIELHGFSDASECAFGACIYVRCINSAGIIASNLLCAKSRVAPLKKISIPRLELCAAVLLARLATKAINSLEIKWNSKYFWTDSLITLTWIRGEAAKWKTFVANRVSEIQTLTDSSDWNHVKSGENPADLLSRGTTPKYLEFNNFWWHGPKFLCTIISEWKTQELVLDSDVPEVRITAVVVQIESVANYLLNKFSNITKINRILAYVIRFTNNLKLPKESRVFGVLTPEELDFALNSLIRIVQKEGFPKEYDCLKKGLKLHNKSKILSLNPFLHDSLIRAGGRIQNSRQCFDKVYPIILPKGHILSELIVKREHVRLFHAGVQNLLASIREKYWPISGRNLCKKIIKNCIVCYKVKPITPEYLMGELPDVRVNKYLPFHNVGTDFCGPFLQKDRKGRGAKTHKIYICLFICMCTKAVHLETVSELTTDAFLATLHRFVSRRGKPLNIYSDNALNYVGANNELVKLYSFLNTNSENIANQLATDRITWHFIPARSPSFGGIWEAGIKSTKFHIKRVIGNQALTFEEFNTIIIQIEAILNSRPLCPLTSDPNDATALTPAHFLIGKSLTALPEQDLTSVSENRLSRWQRLQAVIQHYWARWHKEYLAELQTRTKLKQRHSDVLKVGSLVLVKEDNIAPLDWQLGRVTELFPGKDGVTRVVNVKMRGNIRKRAINRICVLPVDA